MRLDNVEPSAQPLVLAPFEQGQVRGPRAGRYVGKSQ